MPKSAFAANNQARMVAADILQEFIFRARGESRYRNICWSFLAPNDSVKIGANYTPGDVHGVPGLVPSESFVSKPDEPPELRKENYEESLAWYATITAEIFQKQKLAPAHDGQTSRG
jgi:hypothetical protein